MSTPHRDPAVQEEMRRIRSAQPRYGYDSRRRARARQDAEDHRNRVHRHLAAIIVLLAVVVVIIGWDHERAPLNLPRPTEPANVTAPASPHPATTPRHPSH